MSPRSRVLLLTLACAAVAAILYAVTREPSTSPVEIATPVPAASGTTEAPNATELAASAMPDRARVGTSPTPAVALVPDRAPAEVRPDLEVRGRLVGADGTGVPDVACAIESVYVMNADGSGQRLWSEAQSVSNARSGPDGAFVCALTSPAGGRIVNLSFACRAPGYAVISRYEHVLEGQTVVELGDLALLAGAKITGFVRDAAGVAVHDAAVDAISSGENGWIGTGVRARSNADGSFALEGVPAGRLRLTARTGDSRASEPLELTVHANEVREGIVLELPRYTDPFAVSGVVYDLDGSRLSEAHLHWMTLTGSSMNSNVTRAGRDGAFRIQGAEGTVFRVTASHPRGAARAVSRDGIAPGTHGIELRLTPLVTIPLRVRRPDGAFVPTYTYWVIVHMDSEYGHSSGSGEPVTSTPGPSGVTAIPLPADPFDIEVEAAGYTSERTARFAADDVSLSIDVVLRPLPELRGRVVRDREPVAGARVRAQAAFDHGSSATADVFDLVAVQCDPCTEVTTGADGTFAIRVTREGRWHARVAADGHPSVMSGAVELASGGAAGDVLVDLGPRGAIAGHVRDARGAVLARRTVAASCGDGDPAIVVTDAEGAYRLEPLAPGTWQVRVLDPLRSSKLQSSSRDGDEQAPPIAWDCRVANGAVTGHDLVVADR